MELLRKHRALLVVGLVLVIGSYFVGVSRGRGEVATTAPDLANLTENKPTDVDFGSFWKAWNLINEKYVPASTTAKQITDQEKVYGAIEGLAASLKDPYTVFFPPVESKLFASDIKGNFEGIGAEIVAQDGAITVIAPLKDSPSEKAGIKAGDRIVKIGDKTTSNLSTEDAVQLIRGERGTTVILTLVRLGVKEPIVVNVTRDIINIPIINTDRLENGIFKIDLYSFSENSPNLFRGALREFLTSGDQKLIIDLRGNPGGYLEAAIDMASWFLPSSKVVVREDFGGQKEEQVYRSRGYDIFNDNLKLIILVNGGSASASEILAGALQEHGKAKLVGETTFGKGSVQELVNVTKDTSIKITVARWVTPNGTSISEKGITPDYLVPPPVANVANTGADPQLQKAIDLLNQ